ncbi:MAG: hypothetical protein HN368_01920 [Spirochaetales bacterium]|nr:hypothetical protein [Spirochaetales bacterium]
MKSYKGASMNNCDLRSTFLRFLVDDVAQNLERFDSSTGRFKTGDGWAVTNQDLIYPLALLFKTADPDNIYYDDSKILEFALRGGDALRNFQNPDGTVEFIKVDGSTWGDIYMPWSMYHWLEAFVLLEDKLDAERKARWVDGLTLAYDGICAELESAPVHNIPVWNAMAIYRAGRIFGRDDWIERGVSFVAASVEAQEVQGYWKEHEGPTPSYNLVYVHALGLYHFFSGDDSVLPCLERATEFHIRYTYPDGRCVETIDGRVKYLKSVSMMGLASLSLFPKGRRYARLLTENMDLKMRNRREPQEKNIIASGSIKTAIAEYGLNARLASAFQHFRSGPEEDISLVSDEFHIHDKGIAILRYSDGWYSCVSGFVTPPVAERWGLDRQNYFSLWQNNRGLIVGGGNSKDQPEWSTFSIDNGSSVLYIPDGAELRSTDTSDKVLLNYGPYRCTLEVSAPKDGRIEVRMTGPSEAATSSAAAIARLPLRLQPGDIVETERGDNFQIDEDSLKLNRTNSGSWIKIPGAKIRLPESAEFNWPVLPFNPYTADGKAPIQYAVAILSADLSLGEVSFLFEV